MKINKYILQQRQQRWNNNENNKLLEIKPIPGEWKQSLKNRKEEITLYRLRIGHTRITHSYLLEAKQQPMYYACQTKYTVKYIRWECTDQVHIRKTFYSANNMKELFQNTEINYVISFLKTVKLYTKNLKKFTIRPNYFYKPFLYQIYSNKLIPSPTGFIICFVLFFMIMIPNK